MAENKTWLPKNEEKLTNIQCKFPKRCLMNKSWHKASHAFLVAGSCSLVTKFKNTVVLK